MDKPIERNYEATLVVKYRFEIQPKSQSVRVYHDGYFCGYVSNGDCTVGGLPDEVMLEARKFLYEVHPELNPINVPSRAQLFG